MNRIGLQHLTMNTGHTSVSFAAQESSPGRDRMVPLVGEGRHPVDWINGAPSVWVWVTSGQSAAIATILRSVGPSDPRPAPLALVGVAADEAGSEQLWPLLTDPRHVSAGAPTPARPSAVPWLAVWRLPGLQAHPDDLDWLADFERDWAWAWLSSWSSPS